MADNSNTTFRKYIPNKPQPRVKRGYLDALNNRPIDPAIDHEPRHVQVSYMTGRLFVQDMRAIGLKPPAWNVEHIPPKIVTALRAISPTGQIYKPVTERDRQPEDPDLKFTRPHLDRRGFPLPIPTYCTR